jgi:hypothetical protein
MGEGGRAEAKRDCKGKYIYVEREREDVEIDRINKAAKVEREGQHGEKVEGV